MAGTTERKIYFYRARPIDGSGEDVDPVPPLKAIGKMSFATGERYLEQRDGSALGCWIDRIDPAPRFRIGRIRRSGLPQVEEKGDLSPLEIPSDAGLAEQAHFVWFKHGIVGSEFNFYGPRVGAVSKYFTEKTTDLVPEFFLEPLFRQDALKQLKEMGEIRVLSISARAGFASTLREADRNLGDAFAAAARASGAEEIDLVLRPQRYSRGHLNQGLFGIVKHLFKQSETHEEVTRLQVGGASGVSGKMLQVDLLNDYLVAKRNVVLQSENARAVVSESAYREIEDAFGELKKELYEAAGL